MVRGCQAGVIKKKKNNKKTKRKPDLKLSSKFALLVARLLLWSVYSRVSFLESSSNQLQERAVEKSCCSPARITHTHTHTHTCTCSLSAQLRSHNERNQPTLSPFTRPACAPQRAHLRVSYSAEPASQYKPWHLSAHMCCFSLQDVSI